MVNFQYKERYSVEDLIQIIRILRSPGGCPWDQVQTHASNRRNFLEEAYEAVEAFDRDDPGLMCEELGDVLLQAFFNIQIEEDAGRFTTEDVTTGVCRKLIYRHPHVFGTVQVSGSEEVLVNWEQLKRQEKKQSTPAKAMADVAQTLPALWRAEKVQKKSGLPADAATAAQRLTEAADGMKKALNQPAASEALGELLMAAVYAARSQGIDPEEALHAACVRQIAAQQAQEASLAAQETPEERRKFQ